MALMVVMTLSVSQQYGVLASREQRMQDEVFVGAYGLAGEHFSMWALSPFDSLYTLDGLDTVEKLVFDADTFFYSMKASAGYVSKSGDVFVASAVPTDFLEVELRISGELDAEITFARVYSKTQP